MRSALSGSGLAGRGWAAFLQTAETAGCGWRGQLSASKLAVNEKEVEERGLLQGNRTCLALLEDAVLVNCGCTLLGSRSQAGECRRKGPWLVVGVACWQEGLRDCGLGRL